AAQQTDLDVGAFFETEFVVRHGDTVPERSGVALSFCGRQEIIQIKQYLKYKDNENTTHRFL
ncbi:hypothetical protein LL270_19600, partial [Pseudomonas aestusnigri]|uniref:hypothetical protein n=1 Tax=Halopseudomonas aestusnigri TaxID=857252 RepID=UPI001D18E433